MKPNVFENLEHAAQELARQASADGHVEVQAAIGRFAHVHSVAALTGSGPDVAAVLRCVADVLDEAPRASEELERCGAKFVHALGVVLVATTG